VAGDFADKAMRLAPKVDFVKAVKQNLNELFGESAATVIINHLGAEVLQDPKTFEEGLNALFGKGAEIIMKIILKNLETSSEI